MMRSIIRTSGQDRVCVGFLVNCGPGRWKAYTDTGEPLGFFGDDTAAARAVYQHADAARANPGG